MAVCPSRPHVTTHFAQQQQQINIQNGGLPSMLLRTSKVGVDGVVYRKQRASTVYDLLRIVACELHSNSEYRFQHL
jgi:hypothetical protein